jgi:hypothetical protein
MRWFGFLPVVKVLLQLAEFPDLERRQVRKRVAPAFPEFLVNAKNLACGQAVNEDFASKEQIHRRPDPVSQTLAVPDV